MSDHPRARRVHLVDSPQSPIDLRNVRRWFGVVALACLLAPLAAQAAENDLLPADPNVVVIELRWVGGYGPPRAAEPMLEIRADGRARVASSLAPVTITDSRIELPRLRALLRELAVERHLLDYDAKAVAAAMADIARRDGVALHIEDAATLRLSITTADRGHTIEVEAPDLYAQQYPTVERLQDVVAAERTLTRLAGELTVGGAAGIERLLRAANAELLSRMPTRAALTANDFADATKERGRIVAHFHRVEGADAGAELLWARVIEDEHAAIAIEVGTSQLPRAAVPPKGR